MKYESFSFIQHEWKKSTDILVEFESMANDLLKDLQTDSFIELLLDANRNVQPDFSREMQYDEEFKVGQYSTVPDEIYGKTYQMIDLSLQSVSLVEKFENKIKTTIDILETRDKVYKLINEMNLQFLLLKIIAKSKKCVEHFRWNR